MIKTQAAKIAPERRAQHATAGPKGIHLIWLERSLFATDNMLVLLMLKRDNVRVALKMLRATAWPAQ